MRLRELLVRWSRRTSKDPGRVSRVPSVSTPPVSADEVFARLADVDYDELYAQPDKKP
jgi:hypothetical protein